MQLHWRLDPFLPYKLMSFDLDGAAAHFTDVPVPRCFVAARVHSSDLQPEHIWL